ncbi:hypothetical protein SCP_1301160 [Sparassis crispa]|uniref:Uncharacterized protein n=1 Tax=Sparassis crispa TaxID=139825 RepID=A0A401H1J4_9APHY|nr:hypothetical protein SCP_1301160 [Sparassis crispa]GBE88301.1 hypothetical protein SCP_1301160 [Sparassis crispa]
MHNVACTQYYASVGSSFNHRLLNAPDAPLLPSSLSIAAQFVVSGSDEEMKPALAGHNPLDDLVVYDHEFFDTHGQQILFSAGQVIPDITRQDLGAGLKELEYYDHEIFGRVWTSEDNTHETVADDGGDSSVPEFIARLRDAGVKGVLDSDCESEDGESVDERCEHNGDWAPHGFKMLFMLDLLDNLPHLRLSDDQLRAIIWVMPQARMTCDMALKTEAHTSSLGNQFYMNHPSTLFALDWANPLIRPFIHVYPEASKVIGEFWQAAKWLEEVDYDDLSPMWADWEKNSHRHFYVKELAQLETREYVIPVRWVTIETIVHAEVYDASFDAQTAHFSVNELAMHRIKARELQYNFLDLQHQLTQIHFSDGSDTWKVVMPHFLRAISKGKPMFTIRVMPWGDDVSGNVTKVYNAHTNIYVTNVSLSHCKIAQEYFVRFSSTSPHACASELFTAHFRDLKSDKWHLAYDCQLEQEIIFRILTHVLPADNQQQSESTSVVASKGKYNCQYDKMGGTEAERETNDGYHVHFQASPAAMHSGECYLLTQQFKVACLGVQDAVDKLQSSTGVKDKIATYWIEQLIPKARELQHICISSRATRDAALNNRNLIGDALDAVKLHIKREIQSELMDWVISQLAASYNSLPPDVIGRTHLRPGDHFNPLLKADGINPHSDNTLKILHTYLLGNDKYIWYDTNKIWDKKKEELFAVRLQSSSIDGLTLPALRSAYMVQYKNSLLGKHFKAIQQLTATGELGALLWYPEIKNIDAYLNDLQVLIDNLLDVWAQVDPRRIIIKMKLHALIHLKDDIRRHAP